jgi:hypothetical protein
MNRIPVDVPALGELHFVSSETRKDGEGKTILRDGVPVQRVNVLIMPADGRPEVLPVDVTQIEPFRLGENARIRIAKLTAHPWKVNGRDGVSFAAESIDPLSGDAAK